MKPGNARTQFFLMLEQTKWFVILAIIFRFSLEFTYINFVNPIFSYSGFILDLNLTKYTESWLIWTVLLATFPKRLKKTSDYLMALLLFYFLCPLLVFYGLSNASREHLYILLLGVFLISIFRAGEPFKIPFFKFGRLIAYLIMFLGICLVTAWMIASGGTNYFNLDLTRVYEFRRDVGEVINQGLMGYINTWATKVFGPILLAIALWKKKYIAAFLILSLHILWFGISSQKAVIFYPFLILFVWIWLRQTNALALIPLGMLVIIIFSYFFYVVFENILVSSLFIRRVFFIPSFLTFTYYDFFSKNQFIYWSNSIASWFIDYPYSLHPANLIGDYLDTDANANNSFLSTGYMHAGVLGVILYGILVGLLFRLIDSLSISGLPPWLAVASVIIPANSLIMSADLLTALLTHGMGFAVILLFMLRKRDKEKLSKT